MYVTPFNCRPKPKICRLKPVICRPAQEHSRHGPVMDCSPEPPCVVTDIPKRETTIFLSPIVVAKFIFFAPNLLFLRIWRQWRSVARTLQHLLSVY